MAEGLGNIRRLASQLLDDLAELLPLVATQPEDKTLDEIEKILVDTMGAAPADPRVYAAMSVQIYDQIQAARAERRRMRRGHVKAWTAIQATAQSIMEICIMQETRGRKRKK